MSEHDQKVKEVENILSCSDIVWSKYGGDTTAELAERIVSKLEQQGN